LGVILKPLLVEVGLEMLEGKGVVEDLDCVLLVTTVWGAIQRKGRQTIRDGI
jgi:hypothetical protein